MESVSEHSAWQVMAAFLRWWNERKDARIDSCCFPDSAKAAASLSAVHLVRKQGYSGQSDESGMKGMCLELRHGWWLSEAGGCVKGPGLNEYTFLVVVIKSFCWAKSPK